MNNTIMGTDSKEDCLACIISPDSAVYKFEQQLRNSEVKRSISYLRDNAGLSALHLSVFHKKTNFLYALQRQSCWKVLRNETVPQTSTNDACRGKNARDIAEKVIKSRKLVQTIEEIDKWEDSLNKLHKAARDGNLKKVKECIMKFPSLLNECDNCGCNALYWACAKGNIAVVRTLYKEGVSSTCINQKGETLLHIACITAQSHLISILVKELMVPTEIKDKNKRAAITYTAENGDLDTLAKLLTLKVELPPDTATIAAFYGQLSYLKVLVGKHHVDLSCRDDQGKTALHRAIEADKCETVQYLLSFKVEWFIVDDRKRNVLHFAAECGNTSVLHMIIEKAKAEGVLQKIINNQDVYVGGELCYIIRGKDKGRQAWHYVEVQRYLLHLFVTMTKSGSVDVALFGTVVRSGWGADPEASVMDELENRLQARTEEGSSLPDSTPLHTACFREHVEAAEILLKNGADPNIQDCFGLTPLHIACMRGNTGLVTLLEKHDADTSITSNNGKTPKEVAESNEHTAVVNYIRGNDFLHQTSNFYKTFKQKINNFSAIYLEELRSNGKDVKRHLIDSLRDLSIEINLLLLQIGSGPILEETGT